MNRIAFGNEAIRNLYDKKPIDIHAIGWNDKF